MLEIMALLQLNSVICVIYKTLMLSRANQDLFLFFYGPILVSTTQGPKVQFKIEKTVKEYIGSNRWING